MHNDKLTISHNKLINELITIPRGCFDLNPSNFLKFNLHDLTSTIDGKKKNPRRTAGSRVKDYRERIEHGCSTNNKRGITNMAMLTVSE